MPAGSFSLLALFWQSHIVVKIVILGLLRRLGLVLGDHRRQAAPLRPHQAADGQFETVFWSGQSLDQLYQQVSTRDVHGIAALFVAAMREWKRTYKSGVRSLHGLAAASIV